MFCLWHSSDFIIITCYDYAIGYFYISLEWAHWDTYSGTEWADYLEVNDQRLVIRGIEYWIRVEIRG